MQIVIRPSGVYIRLNGDALDFGVSAGRRTRRTSHAEPDDSSRWNETLDELEFVNAMLAEAEPRDEVL